MSPRPLTTMADEPVAGGMGRPCVVSVTEHAGWAHLVCVAASGGVPAVVERRRVTLIAPGLPTMPYHHESLTLPAAEAEALVARVRKSIAEHATLALRRVTNDLAPAFAVVAIAIRKPPFPALPEAVAEVRKSYRLQCAADGMMYQLAICRAAADLDLVVHEYDRGDKRFRAGAQQTTPQHITPPPVRMDRPAGPPWTQEHRRAYAAGIEALALAREGRNA
jgi:hypothetical protein